MVKPAHKVGFLFSDSKVVKQMKKKYLSLVIIVCLFLAIFVVGCEAERRKVKPPVTKPTAKKPTAPAKKSAEKPKAVEEDRRAAGEEIARVTRVIDGDTIEVLLGQRKEKVRYIGINTPEPNQPFGSEASQKNRELVEGKEVRLVKDVSERDKYGRLLRYVYVGDIFINAELVKLGYANAFTYPPDVKYSELFVQLEREAREKQVGLWAPEEKPTQPVQGQFVGNKRSKKLHNLAHSQCQGYVNQMSESNKVFFDSEEAGIRAGYAPCKRCD